MFATVVAEWQRFRTMPAGPLITPTRFEDAIYKLSTKAPMTSTLRSDEWSRVPVALRERAFFSSTVESVKYLQEMRGFLDDFLVNKREKLPTGEEVIKSQGRAQFVADMQAKAIALGMGPLAPGKAGTIEDPMSGSRLRLIFDTQMQAAYDYGAFKQGNDPAVLNAFPAQRFIREHSVSQPRDYHEANKGVVKRKDDKAFWLSMNPDFGVPWGPWGWNSGMGVEDVDREEAEALGLVSPSELLEPEETDFNAELSASVNGLDADMVDILKRAFGEQVEFSGSKVKWKGQQFAQPKAQRTRKSLREPGAPPAIAPTAPLALPQSDSEDGFPPLERLQLESSLGGSTGAKLYRDPKTGARYVVKRGANPDHIRSEFAADEAYRALGVRVPAAKLHETPEGPVKVARFVEGAESLRSYLGKANPEKRAAMLKQLEADFAVDALLGNWDVVGLDMDNVLVDGSGIAWRIDNGGSLGFRAMGARKTAEEWDGWANELWTMRGKELHIPGAAEAMLGPKKTPTQPAAVEVFGGADFYAISRRAEALDVSALKGILTPEDFAIVEARAANLRAIATRALDHQQAKFKAAFADEKLQFLQGMEKRGVFRGLDEELMPGAGADPGTVTLRNAAGKSFGYLRSGSTGAATSTPKPSTPQPSPLPQDIFWPTIETALKHVGSHMKGGKIGDGIFTESKYKPALEFRNVLGLFVKDHSGDPDLKAMAKQYLAALDAIADRVSGKVTTPLAPGAFTQHLKAPPPAPAPAPAAAPKAAEKPKFASLSKAYEDFAKRVGIPTAPVERWMESLSGAATAEGALAMKAWLWKQLEGIPQKSVFWDAPVSTLEKFLKRLEDNQGGSANVSQSFASWQALVQEVFARTELPYNDRTLRAVRIIRTDRAAVTNGIPVGSSSKLGESGLRALAESASIMRTVSIGADNVTLQAVPYPYILNFYAMERVSRPGKDSMAGDSENEVPIVAGLVPFKFIGSAKNPAYNLEKDATKWGVPLEHLRAISEKKSAPPKP